MKTLPNIPQSQSTSMGAVSLFSTKGILLSDLEVQLHEGSMNKTLGLCGIGGDIPAWSPESM